MLTAEAVALAREVRAEVFTDMGVDARYELNAKFHAALNQQDRAMVDVAAAMWDAGVEPEKVRAVLERLYRQQIDAFLAVERVIASIDQWSAAKHCTGRRGW